MTQGAGWFSNSQNEDGGFAYLREGKDFRADSCCQQQMTICAEQDLSSKQRQDQPSKLFQTDWSLFLPQFQK